MRKSDGESRRRKLLRLKDVRTLTSPVFPDRDGGPTFPLAYTDSDELDGRPTLVVIPGGPGLASVVPYAFYRPRIARAGFRVVMVEHRGVGLSRRDAEGEDLPVEAMWAHYTMRDVLAILDHLGIEKAWLHGTSYGGYLAQLVGVLAPERVAGMFLDTTMVSSEDGEAQREHNRKLFLRGESPQTAMIAGRVRELLASGKATDEELTEVVPPAYELLGARVVERLLALVNAGRRTEWEYLHRQLRKELDDEADPFVFQFDLAGAIWYRELVPTLPDGLPFDTARMFAERARAFPPFEGEPFDSEEALPGFSWPVVLFSGGKDTREPAFLHREMSLRLPQALHVVFPEAAHDLLRFRTRAVLEIERAPSGEGCMRPSASPQPRPSLNTLGTRSAWSPAWRRAIWRSSRPECVPRRAGKQRRSPFLPPSAPWSGGRAAASQVGAPYSEIDRRGVTPAPQPTLVLSIPDRGEPKSIRGHVRVPRQSRSA
jgi:proline iminopeptidase